MRWRLVLEEYGPELRYIKGEENIVADRLSRLEMMAFSMTHVLRQMPNSAIRSLYAYDEIPNELFMAEMFASTNDEVHDFPISYKTISSHQEKDKDLQEKLAQDKSYDRKIYRFALEATALI
jgi:hypothetical protein